MVNYTSSAPAYRRGDRIGGYRVIRTAPVERIDSDYTELIHEQSGAHHIHIRNRDRENAFAVAFKTVPEDSTGVAHILEHTVLCGSETFPVRDPFFSMLKRSLSTFMNAFTASDWTMYPFCTQNETDYKNLLDVYLDAAFYPRLQRLSFLQEGHRLEFQPGDENGDRLVFKGVVYNEMKGAMSSPNQVMGRYLLNALFPDTTYRFNSGGEPAEIPKLTHDHLVAFHRRHYHPSNAYFFTYGDQPLERHLEFIEEKVLGRPRFRKIDPETDVPSQPRWDHPRNADYHYALPPSEDPEKKAQICTSWLTSDIQNEFEVMALTLLSEILLGNTAAPLRKALIDSGLGSSLSDETGYFSDIRDTLFSCGLKDVKAEDDEKIESIVLGTLKELADQGIEETLIESAVHQYEFKRKEITNQPFPFGLQLMMHIVAPWIHGGDPVRLLNFEADLQQLKTETRNSPFFEERIRRHLLENPHRVLFRLLPDPELSQKMQARESSLLTEIRSGLTGNQEARIREDAQALQELQDTQENPDCLPTLTRSDIPPEVSAVPADPECRPASARCYRKATSGIFYITTAAGAGVLTTDELPYVPFFCYALTRCGTRHRDYVDLARRIDLYTGGMGATAASRTKCDEDAASIPFVVFRGKCLNRNGEALFDLAAEMMTAADFTDGNRLKTLLLEYRANMESGVVYNGHRLAMSLAARNFTKSRLIGERWSGIHQLKTIKDLTADLNPQILGDLGERLMAIGGRLFSRDNLRIALVGEADAVDRLTSNTQSLTETLEGGAGDGFSAPGIELDPAVVREGWTTGTTVSFVARAHPVARFGHPDAPVLEIAAKLLRSLYLHREIREKGGAYGGFAAYNSEEGLFYFASYRDPRIRETLEVFDGAESFLRAGDYTEEDITEAILQVCQNIDRPDPPGPKARKAFIRSLIGLTDNARQQYKEEILSVDRKRVGDIANKYFHPESGNRSIAVISGDDLLAAANRETDAPFTIHRI